MKKYCLTVLMIIFSAVIHAEIIHLKNGKKVYGTIVSETIEKIIFKEDQSVKEYPREEIYNIFYHHPSRIKAAVGPTRIKLEWVPSSEAVKHYKIFLRKKGENYVLMGLSTEPIFVISDLTSKTKYNIKIGGTTDKDAEIPSSKEIEVNTTNCPPLPPDKINIVKISNKEWQLSWKPAVDTDGTIIKYTIWGLSFKIREMVATIEEIDKPSCTLKNLQEYDRIEIVSIDNDNFESTPYVLNLDIHKYNLIWHTGMFFPIGKFGDVCQMGYGGGLGFSIKKFPFESLTTGFEFSSYYLPGTGKTLLHEKELKYLIPISFFLHSGYEFEVAEDLFLTFPRISSGLTYFIAKYDSSGTDMQNEKNKSSFYDITIKAGISLEKSISRTMGFGLSVEYGLLAESGGVVSFITTGIHGVYKL